MERLYLEALAEYRWKEERRLGKVLLCCILDRILDMYNIFIVCMLKQWSWLFIH